MFCVRCGRELPEGAAFCPGCGRAVKPEAAPVAVCHADDEIRYLIPNNNYALVSYYIGLFSAFFGIVLGPAAIVTGIKGIKEEDIPTMVGRAYAEANPLYPVPVMMTKEEFTAMYHEISLPEEAAEESK